MPIQSTWYNAEQTVVLMVYSREWTWGELRQHITTELPALLASAKKPCDVIMDMRNTIWQPTLELAQQIKAVTQQCQNLPLSLFIIVIADAAIGLMLKTAFQRQSQPHQQYHHARTFDEAAGVVNQRGAATPVS